MRRFLLAMCSALALAACGAAAPDAASDAQRGIAEDPDATRSPANTEGDTEDDAAERGLPGHPANEEKHRDAETHQHDATAATDPMANAAASAVDAADAVAAVAEAMTASIPDIERQRLEEQTRKRAVVLSVRVRDRRTRRPVVGAIVEDSKSPRPSLVVRRERTDVSGRYEEQGVSPDEYGTIVVRCPTRLFLARPPKIGEAPFVVRNGRVEATIDVDLRICVDPPIVKRFERYAGVYFWGYEDSTFFPCTGMPSEASYFEFPRGYWIVTTPKLRDRLLRAIPTTPDEWHPRGLYVEWLGASTGPDNYGHMADALYLLEVEALYKVSRNIPETCKPPGIEKYFPGTMPAKR